LVKGGVFLRKTPLEFISSVYTNSENAVAAAKREKAGSIAPTPAVHFEAGLPS
jgi:hypothetical protein